MNHFFVGRFAMTQKLCWLALLWLAPFFAIANEISVSEDQTALVAPEACEYQWFHNGNKINGADNQSFLPKESGEYTVVTTDEAGAISSPSTTVTVTATGAVIKIYLIGDSTVANYNAAAYPQTGWGQLLINFFNAANISITNNAIGGRSSRSFMEEGRWTTVRNALVAGDYVFIQFGHNDRDYSNASRYTPVADYKTYLTTYCNEAKAKGAIPVLVSPMVMNAWTGTTMRNVFTENGNNYRGAMLEVATALNVAFVDLNMKSWNLYKTYGAAYNTRFLFKGFVAGEYPNYPDGITDGTHFQEMGSIGHCRMITEGIKELSGRADMANLINNLKPLYSIGVTVNPTGSDEMTTKTGTYPQGVTVTLKTIPKTTSTFQKWNNAAGAQISTATLATVTSGTAATSYAAIYQGAVVTDCNNTPNGTAKLDNCDRCVAGTTGKTACNAVAEAETEACAYDGMLESSNTGFKGTSYINVPNVIGSAITFHITAANGGSAILSFRYAGTTDRPAQVTLNNATLPNNLSFSATGAFTTWKTTDLSLTLLKGANTLKLASTTADGLANIDQIGYVSSGLTKGNCTITGLEEVEYSEAFRVYPNPSASSFHLVSKGQFAYSIFDATGKVLESGNSQDEASVGSHLPTGFYTLQIQQAQSSKAFSIIKK
jgi:lysophospholipase L1-like esterase